MIPTQESLEFRKQILNDRYHQQIETITQKYIEDIKSLRGKDHNAVGENFQRSLGEAREELKRAYDEVLAEEKLNRQTEQFSDSLFDEELRRIVEQEKHVLENEFGAEESARILRELETRAHATNPGK